MGTLLVVSVLGRVGSMLSQDRGLRRAQVLGLVLICAAFLAAIAMGVLWAAVARGGRSGLTATAAALTALCVVSGLAGAVLWGLACQRDLKRHPEGNVARYRLSLRG